MALKRGDTQLVLLLVTFFWLGPARADAQCCRDVELNPFPPKGQIVHGHHEVPTILWTTGTVGGAAGLSALINFKPDDSTLARAGTLAFTTPFTALGTIPGLLLAVKAGGGDTAGLLIPGVGIAAGILGGAIGHSVGGR